MEEMTREELMMLVEDLRVQCDALEDLVIEVAEAYAQSSESRYCVKYDGGLPCLYEEHIPNFTEVQAV